ncbi:aminoacyl-tRNA hydrolase [Segetibacter aerophilus]|uniref:Peptidyl-tRNA hydrolase n=1 Tax=Segetibacter aerophilus TaxID=670293 RepID=A0A512BER6_9BACT|nr:aminoacyl-tRNA hydrolase [Segetibacter aerophilus]GEO10463.1 peptidyl-tRNA hydrolase [Segetibacter aerophilus]
MNKFLIVGLGNVGGEYIDTRHNIGFNIAEALVSKHKGLFRTERLAEVAEIKFRGKILVCIKPTTYMNLSGRAFKFYLDKEKISLENTLTIVDDLALPLSKIRLRGSGSDAGHNGLKDIQATLGTDKYPKLRFGIGSDYPKGFQIDFVLGKWTSSELPIVNKKIEKCVETIEDFVFTGLQRTMNAINNLEFA